MYWFGKGNSIENLWFWVSMLSFSGVNGLNIQDFPCSCPLLGWSQKWRKKYICSSTLGFFGDVKSEDMDIAWVWPPPSNSDHQEYYIFRIGDSNLNLHLPLESWEGATPKI